MKKISTMVLAAFITGGLVTNHSVQAQGELPKEVTEELGKENSQQKDISNYLAFSGVISTIKQDGESLSLVVENPEGSKEMIFPISDDVLVFNSGTAEQFEKDKIKKGLQVEVYFDKTKPMPAIYQPMITPEIIVVHDDKAIGQVKISKFDENLVSLDEELKLHIDEDTILMNKKGEAIEKEELRGQELMVFYTISTRSIPAQTTPKKIIDLDHLSEQMAEVQRIINEDHYMNGETKMIPIRKVAERLGYEVKWQPKTRSVTVSKQNLSFQVSIGNTAYGYNRSLRYFEAAPEIKEGKTYVPEEFLEMLTLNQ